MRERIVVSVGGSLIVPDGIDTQFLSDFRALILKKVAEGFSFYIITGGGKICRRYQAAAKEVYPALSNDALDWLGIHTTRLNGHLIRALFSDSDLHPTLIEDPTKPLETGSAIVVGAGWKPGWSTDYDAVLMARGLGAKRLVNLSNIDYVYTADPRTNPDAKPIERISWADFRKLIPEQWDPGLSSPFDPVAAKEAEALGLEIAMINGAKLDEFENCLDGKPFIGTVIS